MLTLLRVSDLAIIDRLEIEPGPGLNVVTGETGAGKSILVDALSLVLGGKGRPELVRTGAQQAEVEALFDLGTDPALQARLEAAGIEAEGELVVRRVVQAGGRSRAFVNGRLATATQLEELARGLVDISSQHEHHTLVDPGTHLGYLDAFARLGALRDDVQKAHAQLAEAEGQLREISDAGSKRAEREDLLRYQVREIDEVAPKVGERETLRESRERLRHSERLARTAGGAEDVLYASDGALCEQLARVAADVGDAGRLDPKLLPLAKALDEARAQLEEAARELGHYARGVTSDPEKLAETEERLDALGRLERKYGGSIDEVLAHRARAQAELERFDKREETLAALTAARDAALESARKVARTLSEKRRKAAEKLGKAITDELASLGMGGAKIEIELARLEGRAGDLEVDGARLSATGIDRAELLIAPNRGEEARPLRKIASGGELSRAMLAIKRVLADGGPAGLYVFDEVDSGVGGAVAEVIGRKLKDVARHSQVVCVTHLAQIAVFADAHYRVAKEVAGGRTRSTIERLGEDERNEEIARMLGGLKITTKTRAAAAEMLRDARS